MCGMEGTAAGKERFGEAEGLGVVLAGGTSRRLGSDKRVIILEGQTLLQRAIAALQGVFERVCVAAGPACDLVLPGGVEAVHDVYPGDGPLAGIHASLSACRAPYAFVAACDMPFLNASLVRQLLDMASGYDAVVPRAGGKAQCLHAVYAAGCAVQAEDLLLAGERAVERLLGGVRVRYVEEEDLRRLDPGLSSFFNVNTPEDLAEAEIRAASLSN
jgi:molybdopterin-guanine dinucleotide biosynthesis protein A